MKKLTMSQKQAWEQLGFTKCSGIFKDATNVGFSSTAFNQSTNKYGVQLWNDEWDDGKYLITAWNGTHGLDMVNLLVNLGVGTELNYIEMTRSVKKGAGNKATPTLKRVQISSIHRNKNLKHGEYCVILAQV
jgi:hypothetical protein